MLYFANWKIALICAVCALGVLLSLPNLLSSTFLARLPSWLPHKQVALGLDLRGGSYLLLEVDVAAAQRENFGLAHACEHHKIETAPFAFGEKKWDAEQINGFTGQTLYPVLRRAAPHYDDPEFRRAAARLPVLPSADPARVR